MYEDIGGNSDGKRNYSGSVGGAIYGVSGEGDNMRDVSAI